MKTLLEMHRSLLNESTKPINPTNRAVIVPMNKWDDNGESLQKAFRFKTVDDRNEFMAALLDHEMDVQHHAKIFIDADTVSIKITTKNLRKITEIDYEYAKFTDEIYKDIVNRPSQK